VENLRLECLNCGTLRTVERAASRHEHEGECPRCGYLGWAASTALSEQERHALRARPPERRRLLLVS
jgi:Zn finger protein HypA/HybF involved in hydrogenase expression